MMEEWSKNDRIGRVMTGNWSADRVMIGLCTSISEKSIFSLDKAFEANLCAGKHLENFPKSCAKTLTNLFKCAGKHLVNFHLSY